MHPFHSIIVIEGTAVSRPQCCERQRARAAGQCGRVRKWKNGNLVLCAAVLGWFRKKKSSFFSQNIELQIFRNWLWPSAHNTLFMSLV